MTWEPYSEDGIIHPAALIQRLRVPWAELKYSLTCFYSLTWNHIPKCTVNPPCGWPSQPWTHCHWLQVLGMTEQKSAKASFSLYLTDMPLDINSRDVHWIQFTTNWTDSVCLFILCFGLEYSLCQASPLLYKDIFNLSPLSPSPTVSPQFPFPSVIFHSTSPLLLTCYLSWPYTDNYVAVMETYWFQVFFPCK